MYDTRLKMTKARYEQLRDAIRAVADHYGPQKVCSPSCFDNPRIKDKNKALRWRLFNIAMDQLSNDDTHPFFQNGTWDRIIPHVEGFSMNVLYCQDALSDDHIDTALARIQQELGLCIQQPPSVRIAVTTWSPNRP